ncbi:heavy metal translocating P-type ATPase [Arcobacter sp.]|uniref:heavy metal translocating P-type ATPase n=1 Tax=Arcobacter sp. TaxID=1872629 RepID=UPI003D0D1B56
MAKEKINLNISGMTCVNCSKGIENFLNKKNGVLSANVSFASSEGEFLIDNTLYSKEKIVNDIQKLGYKAEDDLKALEEGQIISFQKLKKIFFISLFLTICIFCLSFLNLFSEESKKYLIFCIASIVQFYCGWRFYKLGIKSVINKNYDMNVLVVLGTSAAYFYSSFVIFIPSLFPENLRFLYFDGAAVIITFILLGRYLEENSKLKASDFLKKLMNLAPLNANLIDKNQNIKVVLASSLELKDIVIVKSGEKIPADGLIVDGNADIDTSMITGESMPIFKQSGDEVLSGTLNSNGVIKIEVTKKASDTTLSKIITLLRTAQSKQIPISRFADKVANIFVPSVIFISIFTFFVWGFIFGDFQNAIVASISVLIISCPCALGLATPIAIVSSVSRGAKEGILIKNPEILEEIKEIKYAVFDKTGTLTKGEITVSNTDIEEKYFELIGSIENYSEHPISKAIVNFIKEKGYKLDKEIKDIDIIAGKGIKAFINSDEIVLGNKKLLDENSVQIDKKHEEFYLDELEKSNGLIYVSINKKTIGSFSLEDKIKDDAIKVIQDLKKLDIEPILLTGDNNITAQKIAKVLGIEKVYSEVLPTQKYEVIKELQKSSKVMFIGDGINDAPSIKQANIGIALNSGSDISKDAGDIILINNELNSIIKSIRLSIESMKIVKENLFWAFAYNILGIPLAAGILYPFFGLMLSPMYAGIAMSFSSVSVVLNSLRLKIKKL